jgi:xanthine dehydrogenase accessory factor
MNTTTSNPGSELGRFKTAFAVILGTNEIASAIAVYLRQSGWSTVLSHDPHPPVIRRGMAFHDALFGDPAEVEGIKGTNADTSMDVAALLEKGDCAVVTRLGPLDLIPIATIHVLIDARMQKRKVTPDLRQLASLTVGIGPEFTVAENCDIAIETRPEKNGTVLSSGRTDPADGKASLLGGTGAERFVYSQQAGRWHSAVEIGTRVYKNFPAGVLNGVAVSAPFDGIVRGAVRDGTEVPPRVKLLEIDPRGRGARWTGIDERGRAIAEASLKAIASKRARQLGAGRFEPAI